MQGQAGAWGPHPIGYVAHTMALCSNPGSNKSRTLQLACGSFIPDAPNFVDAFTIDLEGPEPVKHIAQMPHYYPPTRVRWFDGAAARNSEFLVTSGDCLRIWSASGELQMLLRHTENPQNQCTPISSVDTTSNPGAAAHLVSCDVYGICTLWDMAQGAMVQAFDLGQPLWDVAFGPDRLIAVAGDLGNCFLIDPRQPQEVNRFLAPQKNVRGPARIAWGARRPDLFAVAWQNEQGGLALYNGSKLVQGGMPQMLQSHGSNAASIADLQWSPAFPEMLCCAKEDGAVEVWQFPEDGLDAITTAARPSFCWEPGGCGEACTALALSPEIGPGQHALILATMPQGQSGSKSQQAVPPSGSLWIATLPEQSGRRHLRSVGSTPNFSENEPATGNDFGPIPTWGGGNPAGPNPTSLAPPTGTGDLTSGGIASTMLR